jgi:hypothetical protein
MMPTPSSPAQSYAHRLGWHAADSAGACLITPPSRATSPKPTAIARRKLLSARSPFNSQPTRAAKSVASATATITRTPELPAKSP